MPTYLTIHISTNFRRAAIDNAVFTLLVNKLVEYAFFKVIIRLNCGLVIGRK